MPDIEEVVVAVKKTVEEIGATSKKNYEDLNRNFEEFKSTIKAQGETDPVTLEKLDKLASDISTRQEEADTASKAIEKAEIETVKRLDALEVSAKRIGNFGSSGNVEEDRQLIKDAFLFERTLAAAGQTKLGFAKLLELKKNPNFEQLNKYVDVFNEFLHVDEKAMSAERYKSLQVGIDVDGGYTVPPTMSNRIVTRLWEQDPVRQLVSSETIGTDAFEMLADTDEAGAEWEGETVQNDEETTPKLGKLRINVHVLATHPKITQMLLDDSNINIENWLGNKVADKFSRTEQNAFIVGNGVGKPKGFGTYDNWDVAGTYQSGKIEQINMGHATKFTTDGLVDVKYSMIEQHLTSGTWLTNRLSVRDIMKLKDGDGQYIWRAGITEGQPAMLLGLPFRMATSVATAAANALSIYLADWKQTYLIIDRQGINVQRDPFTKKPFVEFYTRKRVGGGVINFQSIKIGKIAV